MTHMVTYRSGEGQPVYHPTESLEEAARHVEQLRNAGQGADARIFRLEEIPMEVKTYYKVEVPGAAAAVTAEAAPATPAAPAALPDAAAPAAEGAAAPAAAAPAEAVAAAGANGNGGRFGLFGKG